MIPIDDNEAFKIRANAGDGPACDVNPIEPIPLTTPLPPEVPCDDPPEPDTETFFEPAPAPPAVRQPRLPGSIKLYSPELPLNCPPGTTLEQAADSTVLDFGALTRTINFTDVLGDSGEPLFDQSTLYNLYNVAGTIRDAVYAYIGPSAPAQDPARSVYINDNFDSKVALLVNITKLPSAIVAQFWHYILNQQVTLDAAAKALADRQLDCGFFNVPLWVICYDQEVGEYRISYSPPFASGAVFVPAGTAFSSVDIATANALAIESAVNVPICQFKNQAQDVSCAELFGGDFLDSVLFSWPTLQSPQTTKLSDIGGHVTLDANGTVLPRTKGYEALIYAEVASRGTAAEKRELVLKVSVPVGLTTGNTQAEADAKARALALSYLDCFIPSRVYSAKCTDLNISESAFTQAQNSSDDQVLSEIVTGYTTLAHLLPTIKPDNVTIINQSSGPVIDTRVAVRLQVPAGAFVSDSRQAADTEAASFALSNSATTLNCDWANRRVIYACDDKVELTDSSNHLDDPLYVPNGVIGKTYDGPYEIALKRGKIIDIQNLGTTELMAIVDKSDPYFVVVERSEFESSTSQADADRIAGAHAISLLNCVYCNPRIEPNCPPDGYTPFESLPLFPGANGYSFDATQGVPGVPYFYDESATPPRWRIIDEQGKVPVGPLDREAWICSIDPVDVARVAGDSSGTALRSLDTSLECRFCNDQVNAACCASSATDEDTYVRFSPAQCVQLANAFDNFTVGECAGNQISDPFNQVVVPACSMFAGSKEAANELALNVAMAQLNCLFANAPYEATCEPACVNLVDVPFSISVGGKTYNGRNVGPVFVGTETAEIPAGIYRSACSQEQADAQAKELGDAQLVCLWTNNAQTAECPELANGDSYHSTAVTTVTIPEGTIVTEKCTPYANEIALRLAVTQLFCVLTNDPQEEKDCPPGYALITAGVVEVGTIIALSKVAANGIAKGIAKASKVCEQIFYQNTRQYDDECPSGSSGGIVGCEGGGGGGQIDYRLVEAGIVDAGTVVALTQAKADQIAKSLAASSKICEQVFYANNPQNDDTCPEGYELIEEGSVDACVVVAPKQEIADAIAKGIAKASKVCEQIFYQNTRQYDDKCPSGSGGGGGDCSAGGGGAVEYRLVEAGIVEAGTIVALSQQKADDIAKGIARASKVCEQVFYGNDSQRNDECPEGYKLIEAGVVNACEIIAPQKNQANDIAKGLAKATKICEQEFFDNDYQEDRQCPPKFQLVEAGVVSAGEITAPKKDKANQIAKGLAKALKICEQKFYENTYQYDDKCPSGSGGGGGDCSSGGGGAVEYRLVEAGVVAAGTVLALTQEKADQIAKGLARASKVCEQVFYGNDYQEDSKCPTGFKLVEPGIINACEVIAPQKAKANQIAKGLAKATKICEQEFFDNDYQEDGQCPPKFQLVEAGKISAGEITATKKEKANQIARGLAKATKICEQVFYENDYQEDRTCPKSSGGGGGGGCAGGGGGAVEYRLVEPGVVAAGEIIALTKEKANAIAKGIAKASTVCEQVFYGNDTQTESDCPRGYKLIEAGVVESCAVVAPQAATANKIAKGIAKASKICELIMYPNAYQSYSSCPDGFELENAGVVAAGEIETPKQETSDSIARAIARASVECKLKLFGNSTQTNSECPDSTNWELIASGYVGGDTIKTNDQASSDAIALGLATARTRCKIKLFGNSTQTNSECPNSTNWELIASGYVGGDTIKTNSQAASDAIALGLAKARTHCDRKIFFNSVARGMVECEEGEEEVINYVEPGNIPSWQSEGQATEIAQGIADALSYCKQKFNKLPQPPGSGTYVLGSVGGSVQWLATSDCDEESSGGDVVNDTPGGMT